MQLEEYKRKMSEKLKTTLCESMGWRDDNGASDAIANVMLDHLSQADVEHITDEDLGGLVQIVPPG